MSPKDQLLQRSIRMKEAIAEELHRPGKGAEGGTRSRAPHEQTARSEMLNYPQRLIPQDLFEQDCLFRRFVLVWKYQGSIPCSHKKS